MRKVLIAFFLFLSSDILGQNGRNVLDVKVGRSYIPLYIERTNAIRWMIYPTLEVDYFFNEKIAINASFAWYDMKIGKYDYEEDSRYLESPYLSSYEVAKENEGNKYTFSSFSDYFFIGIKYRHSTKKSFRLNSNLGLGFRHGETSVLEYAIYMPSYPNGFEAISSNMNSTGPGIKLGIAPGFLFWDFITVDFSVGTYMFINWPVFQPYGNLALGLSF